MKTISLVYVSLIFLLALTLVVSSPLSLLIAIAKAALILIFFMKLRESSPSLRLVALSALLWIIFLFGLTSADYLTRGMIGVLGK